MSQNDLLNKYSSWKKSECNFKDNIVNPERCPASKLYTEKLRDFVVKTIQESELESKQQYETVYQSRLNDLQKNIYPLVNYEFDYKTAMRKMYNPYNLGITNQPTMKTLINAPSKLKPYIDILAKNKFPNANTIPGKTDVIEEDLTRKEITDGYYKMDMTLPYPSFRKDYPECRYPTTGEHASSYFVKTGVCKTKIPDEASCKEKGYSWSSSGSAPKDFSKYVKNSSTSEEPVKSNTPQESGKTAVQSNTSSGVCNKPRYSYIDNSSRGFFNNNGMVPSMMNDMMSISPDKLLHVLSGYSVNGSGLLPCTEEFSSGSNKKKMYSKKIKYSKKFFKYIILYSIPITILFVIALIFIIRNKKRPI
jgi:hypothetical protein